MKSIETTPTHHSIAVLVLVLACGLVYGHTLNSPFVFDDFPNIRENNHIRIADLSLESLGAAGFKSPSSRRPVANISFAINYYFGEYDVRGYHIVNITIHIINGILVYILAGLMIRPSLAYQPYKGPNHPYPALPAGARPLIAAALFVVHPLQIQSVTYIVQRMNSMAVMFYLSSFLLYLYARLSHRMGERWTLLAGSLIAWVLGMGTKEISAPLPLVVLLYEWYFFQDLSPRWLKKNLVYPLALILFLGVIIYLFFGGMPFEGIGAGYQDRDFTMGQRVLTQFRTIIFYLSLVILPLPSRLNLLHPMTVSTSLINPFTTFLSFCAIAALLGWAIAGARRHRMASFCILWFFIHLAIESSIIGLEMVFEHRLYLPLVGIALLCAHIISAGRFSKSLGVGVGIVLIIGSLGTATIVRNGVWSDRLVLWEDVIAKNPRSARGHTILSSVLEERGKRESAASHYAEAVALDPKYVATIHNKKGSSLYSQGLLDDAAAQFRAALGLRPDYAKAHNNLGVILLTKGRPDEAIQHFSLALALLPDDAQVRENLENARREEKTMPPVEPPPSTAIGN